MNYYFCLLSGCLAAGSSRATNCQPGRLWRWWCWYWEETSLCSGDKFSPDCDGGEGGGGCIVTGNILYIVSPRTSPLFISQWALQSQTLRKTLGLVARWMLTRQSAAAPTVVAKIMRGDDDWRFPDWRDRKWYWVAGLVSVIISLPGTARHPATTLTITRQYQEVSTM